MTGLSASFSSGATTVAYRLLAAVQAPFYPSVCLSVYLPSWRAGWLAGWSVERMINQRAKISLRLGLSWAYSSGLGSP